MIGRSVRFGCVARNLRPTKLVVEFQSISIRTIVGGFGVVGWLWCMCVCVFVGVYSLAAWRYRTIL